MKRLALLSIVARRARLGLRQFVADAADDPDEPDVHGGAVARERSAGHRRRRSLGHAAPRP